MIKSLNKRIANTDIFVFRYNPDTQNFTYSKPFSQEEAQALVGSTNGVIKTKYKGAKGLRQGLTAIEGSLVNMSTLKGIVANNVLMEESKGTRWLPTMTEWLAIHEAGMLPSGFLTNFGIALYNVEKRDEEIAQAMMKFAGDKNYSTPILASFISLNLINGGEQYGVTPQLVSPNGLIVGNEAVKLLEKFYKADSGVCRVDYGADGCLYADWSGLLDFFTRDCRMGRFSAAGSAEKLREETLGAFAPISTSLDSIIIEARAA